MLKLRIKLRSLAKTGLLSGTCLAFALGITFQAFGIPLPAKPKAPEKSNPAELLVLRNWGLDNSENPSHIHILDAWKITKGDRKIKVAVIDTGIDANHPDLKDSLCRKPGTDEYGWDFVTNKKNPEDHHGHGTHVAGIIAANAKKSGGAMGVAPNVCIMAIRYYSEKSTGAQNLINTVKAINYAIDNGANIINYSGGGAEYSANEMKAIKRAEDKGILFVAAAGNEYQNTDEAGNAYYPAAYGLSNIISVAASNIRNQLVPASNWGKKHVHLAAPGESIYSTVLKGRYGYMTGTSQGTPHVTGTAALMLSVDATLKPLEVRDILVKSVDKIPALAAKLVSGGRLNAAEALRLTVARKDGAAGKVLAKLDAEELKAQEQAKERKKPAKRNVAFH
jgi:thermitase